jgi:DNA (cytosine-5)-methyltransferase 1
VVFLASGFRVVGAVEMERDPAASYEQQVGIPPIVADIRDVSGADLVAGPAQGEELTLVFGCPPCQSFTILRRGRGPVGLDAARDALPSEYLRLVRELMPRYIAFENVPGFSEGRGRAGFERLVASLEHLGYAMVWGVLDAADFGVPQRRRRLLVLGSRVGKPVLPKPTHGSGNAPHVTVREAIGDLPPLASGEADRDDPMHRARRHREVAIERLRSIPEGGGRMDLPRGLQLHCHTRHAGHYDIYGRMSWDRPAPTLTSGCTNVTRGRFAHPEQHRAITAREALLLQSFGREAMLEGGTESVALQIGNAIPPLLARRIGEAVLDMERARRPTAPSRRG